MGKFILTVTLNPALDKTVRVDRFRMREENRVGDISSVAGGKGINVSRVLTVLGASSKAIGLVGGTSGGTIEDLVVAEEIDAQFTRVHGPSRTNTTLVDKKGRSLFRLLEDGPAVTAREMASFLQTYRSLLRRALFVVLSGSAGPGIPRSIYAELIAIASKAGVLACLDASGLPLRSALKARPYLIKPNLAEAEEASGMRLTGRGAIKRSIASLREKGARIVVISMGERGAVAGDGDQVLFARVPRVARPQSVGCGDALLAGFLFAKIRKSTLADALISGVAAGTCLASGPRAGAFDKRLYRGLLEKVRVAAL